MKFSVTSDSPLSHEQLMDWIYRYQPRRRRLTGDGMRYRAKPNYDGAKISKFKFVWCRYFAANAPACRIKGASPQVGKKIMATHGDAGLFDAENHFMVPGFDRVILSYSLSMIPEWKQALSNALSQVSDRGSLYILDFGDMERWPAITKFIMRKWLTQFCVTLRSDLVDYVRSLSGKHSLKVTATNIAGGYAIILVISRLWMSCRFHETLISTIRI